MKKNKKLFCVISLLTLCSCGGENIKKGEFFSVQELFSSNILTNDDLLNISYWNNGEKAYDKNGEELVGIENNIKTLTPLTEEVEADLISNYQAVLRAKYTSEESKEDIKRLEIAKYCGFYNGYYAVRFYDIFDVGAVTGFEIIGDYTFVYPYRSGMKVELFKYR